MITNNNKLKHIQHFFGQLFIKLFKCVIKPSTLKQLYFFFLSQVLCFKRLGQDGTFGDSPWQLRSTINFFGLKKSTFIFILFITIYNFFHFSKNGNALQKYQISSKVTKPTHQRLKGQTESESPSLVFLPALSLSHTSQREERERRKKNNKEATPSLTKVADQKGPT